MRRSNHLIILFYLLPALALGQGTKSAPQKEAQGVPSPVPQPRMIWDYKRELALSEEQTDALQQAMSDYQKDMIRFQSRFQVTQIDLVDLIKKSAELDAIKAKLEESAAIEVDINMANIVAARKIDGILNAEQRQRWHQIQAQGGLEGVPDRRPRQ